MLVLSRRPNEKIVIPSAHITLHVLSMKGNCVRLGIEAPPDVAVMRQELLPQATPMEGALRKALVVEDDRLQSTLLAGVLRLAGFEVALAGDGADALDYLRRHDRPDVVLLDMVMPGWDGPTTLRAIREEPACEGIKVFGLSVRRPEEFDFSRAATGLDGWFNKPVEPELMLRELDHYLGWSTEPTRPATLPRQRPGRA